MTNAKLFERYFTDIDIGEQRKREKKINKVKFDIDNVRTDLIDTMIDDIDDPVTVVENAKKINDDEKKYLFAARVAKFGLGLRFYRADEFSEKDKYVWLAIMTLIMIVFMF